MKLNARIMLAIFCLSVLISLSILALVVSGEPATSIKKGMTVGEVQRILEVDGDARAGRLDPDFPPHTAGNSAPRSKNPKYQRFWENRDYRVTVTFLRTTDTCIDTDPMTEFHFVQKTSWFTRLIRRVGF